MRRNRLIEGGLLQALESTAQSWVGQCYGTYAICHIRCRQLEIVESRSLTVQIIRSVGLLEEAFCKLDGLWRFGWPQGFVERMGALMRDKRFLLQTVVKPLHCTTTTREFSMVASQVPLFLWFLCLSWCTMPSTCCKEMLGRPLNNGIWRTLFMQLIQC